MIVISIQNIELIKAKEGVWSPVGRATLGHWSSSLAGKEVSNGRACLLCYLGWMAYLWLHVTFTEPTNRKMISQCSFFFPAEKFKSPASGSGNTIRPQTWWTYLLLLPGREGARKASQSPQGGKAEAVRASRSLSLTRSIRSPKEYQSWLF